MSPCPAQLACPGYSLTRLRHPVCTIFAAKYSHIPIRCSSSCIHSDFNQTIQSLSSSDNAVRAHAENLYNHATESNPTQVASGLFTLFRSNPDDGLRNYAGILLRRIVIRHWEKIDGSCRQQMQQELLRSIETETKPLLVRRACHLIAGINTHVKKHPWAELLPFVVGCAQNAAPLQRETGFFLLSEIAEFNSESLIEHVAPLQPLLLAGIQDQGNTASQKRAIQASCSLIISVSGDKRPILIGSLMPAALAQITALVSVDEQIACEAIESLIEMAQHAGSTLGNLLPHLAPPMIQMANSLNVLENSTRSIAVELLLTVCEACPSAVTAAPALTSQIIDALMRMSCEVETNEAQWVNTPFKCGAEGNGRSQDELEEEEMSILGEESLFRAVRSLGRNAFDSCLSLITQWSGMQGPVQDWRAKRAAISVFQATAIGAPKALKNKIKDSVGMMVACVSDPVQRVRFNAIECLAVFAETFPGVFQKMYNRSVVPALVAVLQDTGACDKVKGQAAAALIEFANPESCTAKCMEPHLQSCLGALFNVLTSQAGGQPASIATKEQIVLAVANVAEVSNADFEKYYDNFMPGIKSLIASATDKESVSLRGNAMTCAAMMGEAVGTERFQADGVELMRVLLSMRGGGGAGGQGEGVDMYLAQACCRICKVLGDASAPYLPQLVPPLIQRAARTVKFDFADSDEGDAPGEKMGENGMCSSVVNVRGMGMKRISLDVGALEDKQEALNLLFSYCEEMENKLLEPYVEEIAKVVTPLITDKMSHVLRKTSALIFSKILQASSDALKNHGQTQDYALAMLTVGVKEMVSALIKERDTETRVALAEALSDTMCVCSQSGGLTPAGDGSYNRAVLSPSPDAAGQLVTAMLNQMTDSINARAQFQAALDAGDMTIEQLEEQLELEDEFMTNLIDAHGYTLKTLREAFVPIFDQCSVPFFTPLMQTQTESLRINAICVFDDAIEFCGDAVHKHLPMCAVVFLTNLRAEDTVLRQCAVYGLAKMAEFAQGFFKQYVSKVVPRLVELINAPDSRDEDNESATENAISAVGKICRFHPDQVNLEQLLPMWLSWLPLTADCMEAKAMHAQLLTYIEAGDPRIIGNIPALLSAIGGALAGGAVDNVEEAEELVEEATAQKLGQQLKIMQAKCPPAAMAAAWAGLPPLQQAAIMAATQ
jgi:hypothetical protein